MPVTQGRDIMKTLFVSIGIPVCIVLLSASCVSSKKYKTAESARVRCEETANNLSAEKQLLMHDTTEYGIRYRSLAAQKNFIEQTSAAQIAYLNEKLENNAEQLKDLQAKLDEQSEELQQYQEGWQERLKLLSDMRSDIEEELKTFKLNSTSLDVQKGRLVLILPADDILSSTNPELTPKGEKIIAALADLLKDYSLANVVVEVHTDNEVPIAPYENNVDMSTAEANLVTDFMKKQSFPSELLKGVGLGYAQPVASLETVEGRQENRRIRFIIAPAYSMAVK